MGDDKYSNSTFREPPELDLPEETTSFCVHRPIKLIAGLVTVHLASGIYDQIIAATNLPQNVRRLAEQQSGGRVVNWGLLGQYTSSASKFVEDRT